METLLFYLLVIGLSPVLASFLSVVIHRVPRGESIIWPGSHCPACDRRLGLPELLPILGWLLSRGRCRHCGAPIPFRYLLLELLVPVLLIYAGFLAGPSWLFLRDAIFLLLLVVLCFVDLDTMELPHRFTVLGIASGLLFAILGFGITWPDALLGIALGYLLPSLLSLIYRLLRGRAGMGGGDFVLLAMIGAHTGPSGVLLSFLVAVLIGSIVGLVLLRRKSAAERGRLAIPFGPFLALGGGVSLFWAPLIVDAYLRWAGLK